MRIFTSKEKREKLGTKIHIIRYLQKLQVFLFSFSSFFGSTSKKGTK